MVDDGLDGFAAEAAFLNTLRQYRGAFVAPAEFRDETVPHVAFFIGSNRAVGLNPGKDFFVGPALQGTCLDLRIVHSQKTAAASIERVELRVAQQGDLIRRQLSAGMQ